MERYHIFKLGLAITFYAAYCIRPMLVYCLNADNNLENNKNVLNPDHEYFQYFQGVDGRPGRDYPVYSYIPKTTFNCKGIESGYYADLEADCQVFHICEEGRKISFLCPNGTIFQQSELICEWWNKVNCTNSPNLYEESAERLQNEIARRKSSRRVITLNGVEMNHGAVMRMEERTSLRATKNGKEYPVRQKIVRTQRIKNHRIPDNNEIEQQIEEAESNNRHLAKAQTTGQVSEKNSFDDQNPKYFNHNYNAVEDSDRVDNSETKSSSTTQSKKDINRETGNFINHNYDQDSSRHSKVVDEGGKNNYNFGTKTIKPISTTLKEYHVEFGPTSSGVDSSTKSYSTSDRTNLFPKIQNTVIDSGSNFPSEFNDTNVVENDKDSSTYSPKVSIQQSGRSPANDDYGTIVSSRTTFSSTTLAPRQPLQNPLLNGKVNRGSVKFSINSNSFNNQHLKDNHSKNSFIATPVTTYSPPVKYFSTTILQNGQVSNQKILIQDNYELPFPKHKSELSKDDSLAGGNQSDQNNSNLAPKQSTASIFSSETSTQLIPNHTSQGSVSNNEKIANFNNQESDETQVPQESSSFVKNSFNSITDNSFKTSSSSPYPNHRSTYSDIKDISYLEAPKIQSISSITAHLVTTQPINNGKPFVGSRVGTTLLPNQPTTLSKYTYLPTTSTDRSKSTVIFGVIRHSSTTEPPPYGPPEILNLGENTNSPVSDRFNVGNTDKTLPTVETTTLVTNPVPKESFNVGSTERTLKPNIVPTYGTTTIQPLNLFIPVHVGLNIGGGEAALSIDNTNGSLISDTYNYTSIDKTSPLITNSVSTENLNSGITESTIKQNLKTSTNKPSKLYSATNYTATSDRFNIGNTDRTLPTVETTTVVTNAVPTETFNVGYTGNTIKPNVVPSLGTSTIKPLEIYVPDHGSLNLGQNEANVNGDYNGLEPVNEPPFIKKTAPLLYSNQNSSISTVRTVDHATVYGTYASTTQRHFASSNKTPYSPTVPTVTQSSLLSSSPVYGSTTSSRTPKAFNQGIPIRFTNGQDKISVQLSRNLGGQTQTNYKSTQQPSQQKVNAVVRVGEVQQFAGSSTAFPYNQPSGFYVTGDFNKQVPSISPKSKTERPRPFARTVDIEDRFNSGNTNTGANSIGSTFPAYQISSARPFGASQTTASTPFINNHTTPSFSVYDNVDSMMNVLQEIANYNLQNDLSENSRPGLVIPPSVGPQTLHSLAQYFANELESSDSEKEVLKPETKEKITSLLTAMTVHGYNKLFNVDSTATSTDATSTISDDINGVSTTPSTGTTEGSEEGNRVGVENRNAGKDDSTVTDDELLTTTSLPELRQLARNFSLALSSYLNDPDNFKKSLEGLRPTEPPPLDGSDNVESSTTEDELLNFSDADAKPSTPVVPSATWGYIVATDTKNGIQDEIKNSLNPDLNTADSQSFIPRFNNLQVEEKQQKGFTDLPPNHWTSSPQATKLWQKALSINPAVVNEHFETTPSIILSDEDETTESEYFNQEVLPELSEPHSQISYDLRELPPISLNSTQVHGILIDFMNHTKSDEHNRLNRILKKLNTSEEEFLNRMKEIESNPLTKRLVLLLISECGANITQDLGLTHQTSHQGTLRLNDETLSALESTASFTASNVEAENRENQSIGKLVHPKLSEDDEDARALQLLNSLYTIASKFGRKR